MVNRLKSSGMIVQAPKTVCSKQAALPGVVALEALLRVGLTEPELCPCSWDRETKAVVLAGSRLRILICSDAPKIFSETGGGL